MTDSDKALENTAEMAMFRADIGAEALGPMGG